jgi:hypothetical protein
MNKMRKIKTSLRNQSDTICFSFIYSTVYSYIQQAIIEDKIHVKDAVCAGK